MGEELEKTIEEGPLRGLPSWIRDLRKIFAAYGSQISELTALVQELQYSLSAVAEVIVDLFPEEVGKGEEDGIEYPVDVACRLLREYSDLQKVHEPLVQRLQSAEKEIEQLRRQKSTNTL